MSNKLLIIIFLFIVLTVMFTYLIPALKDVYAQLGDELPYYTLLFVQLSDIFKSIGFSVFSNLLLIYTFIYHYFFIN